MRNRPLPISYLGASVLGDEELALLSEVIRNKAPFREYGENPPHMVRDLEAEARAYFESPCAVATATGSGAFSCALAGLGIGPGDEVIIPSFGWYTNFTSVVLAGALPVFADIDASLCIDPGDLPRRLTPRTRALMIVHFQGATGNLAAILDFAHTHHLAVIEDCAQCSGGTYQGHKLGSFGDVSCLSFQQNKIMTCGDGGMLLARSPKVFERAVRYHDLGMVRPSLAAQFGAEAEPPLAGSQFRMNEFSGAVALAQLRKLDTAILTPTRRLHGELIRLLREALPGLRLRPVGDEQGDCGIACYLDCGDGAMAARFGEALVAEGIRIGAPSGCRNLIPTPLVQERRMAHPASPPFGPGCLGEHHHYRVEDCPRTDPIVARLVCVAIAPRMTSADIQDIATAIVKVARAFGLWAVPGQATG